jgi:hypothetical protein
MPKTLKLSERLNHRKISRPCDLRNLNMPFVPRPLNYLQELFLRMGPFNADTDGFAFKNSFVMTAENATQIRHRLGAVGDAVIGKIVQQFTASMSTISVDVPLSGTIGLPQFVFDAVIGKVLGSLVIDNIIGSIPGTMGRCGGMAYAGYDFYLSNWEVDQSITIPPSTGLLGDYIFDRLLDSIGTNASTWMDWFITLHLLGPISKSANIALGVAIGSIGGPAGIAIGALLGNNINLFKFGGRKSIKERTIYEWQKIKTKLDAEAACPIGILFGDSITPLNDHQVLAIGYEDRGHDNCELLVWDNRDGNSTRRYIIHFGGEELNISQIDLRTGQRKNDGAIKGFFLESYSHMQPPNGLKL